MGSNGGLMSAGDRAVMDCPTCRRQTSYDGLAGARSLPKNFELLRVRQEIQCHTEAQMNRLKEVWSTQVLAKENLAQEAEEHAREAQRESDKASDRAESLAKQVEINEQEKKLAQDMAREARHKALLASQQAEALQRETEQLKRQLQHEALQLERVQHDASSAAAVAAELHTKAERLQQQVDCVRAQLSLHSGRHDPSKLVVLVCEPQTVGSWLLPYTRYTVISIASDDRSRLDCYRAARTWTRIHQVAEPSSSVKVYRRYSDFLWLHRELCRKFPFELVPCVPEKQLLFNKEKEFVGERMRLLQAFLRQVLRHAALAVTEETRAFLLSTTEELESMRKASRLALSDDDDAAFMDEDSPEESDGGMRPTAPPPAPISVAAPAVQSSAWAAWGAVSALTTSAAKFVSSTTGSALTGLSGKASPSRQSSSADMTGALDEPAELSHSLVATGNESAAQMQQIQRRRKYIEIQRAYQSAAQKGSHLSRQERKHAQHLHRLCELMHEMDTLDTSFAKRRREQLQLTQQTPAVRQRLEESSYFERRPFDARASEALSSIASKTKNDADCMEYALLEVVRMQTLQLGAIEDAFSRLRRREFTLQQAATGTAGSPPSSSSLAAKSDELKQNRAALTAKVETIDPPRTLFVLETLQKNAKEMHKLAKAKRKLFEETHHQLSRSAS